MENTITRLIKVADIDIIPSFPVIFLLAPFVSWHDDQKEKIITM